MDSVPVPKFQVPPLPAEGTGAGACTQGRILGASFMEDLFPSFCGDSKDVQGGDQQRHPGFLLLLQTAGLFSGLLRRLQGGAYKQVREDWGVKMLGICLLQTCTLKTGMKKKGKGAHLLRLKLQKNFK